MRANRRSGAGTRYCRDWDRLGTIRPAPQVPGQAMNARRLHLPGTRWSTISGDPSSARQPTSASQQRGDLPMSIPHRDRPFPAQEAATTTAPRSAVQASGGAMPATCTRATALGIVAALRLPVSHPGSPKPARSLPLTSLHRLPRDTSMLYEMLRVDASGRIGHHEIVEALQSGGPETNSKRSSRRARSLSACPLTASSAFFKEAAS